MLSIHKSETLDKLIKDCAKGHQKAQKVLFDRYAPKFKGICLRYMGRVDEAEDVMITAFLKIFEKIHTYKGEGHFEGWMRRVVVNQCLSELRKQRYMYLESSLDEVGDIADYEVLEGNLRAEDLMSMVAALPPGYRTVFNLYAIEGYSHKEIALELGINENTSKSQLSRARMHLQKALHQLEMEVHLKNKTYGKQ